MAGQDAWIGRELDGRYRVVELLGEGGMGSVYIAEHRTLRKQVAVKTIRPEFAANRQAEARFTREAMATGKLDHPHVVSAIDYGRLPDGSAYLVTALVRGESLGRRLQRGPLTTAEVCLLGSQVADALVAAHAAGIVHRDLKPDNILLERRDDGSMHAKVVDFGVARMTEIDAGGEAALPITRLGSVIGTPGYMAPEQATGGTIDARVDVYALGVILWECCAGQPLWDPASASQLLIAQLTRSPPNLFPDLAPKPLAELVEKMLARAPDQRPADALVVRDALRKLTREGLIAADRAKAAPAKVAASPAKVAAPTGPNADGAPTVAATPRRSRAGLWIGVAVAAVALLVIATRGGDKAAEPGAEKKEAATAEAKPEVVEKRELKSRRDLLAELPAAYVEHGRALLLGTDRRERSEAGKAMAAAEGADRMKIPGYFLKIAAFETADTCEQRRAVLREIAAGDDVRVLWALRSWSDQPRNECRGKDCLGCLREDLGELTRKLEAAIE